MSDRPAPVILASASPRRREILSSLGVAIEVQPSRADEAALDSGERSKLGRCENQPIGPIVHRILPSEICRNDRTSPGSNWVPALRRSSARACSGASGLL